MSNKTLLKFGVRHSSQKVFIQHGCPFPTNTQGFLYYNVPPPHLPPIMGGLRFRITSSSDPSSFDSGSDLLHVTRPIPWSLPLLHLVRTRNFPICEQLVVEGLISQELLDRRQLVWRNSLGPAHTYCIRSFLYHLDLCTPRHPFRCRGGARLTGVPSCF
jgi:hypothetical protein